MLVLFGQNGFSKWTHLKIVFIRFEIAEIDVA